MPPLGRTAFRSRISGKEELVWNPSRASHLASRVEFVAIFNRTVLSAYRGVHTSQGEKAVIKPEIMQRNFLYF